ncbi:hypothetical protein SADUNF_Sadunf16G0274300 [Salix dunnii]|uniref:Apple domain-containing protein n=1 Tax=Salix dunnii TaxID=1413687 RepID=A0A835MMY2_9ROSI|nr:hypothetical protein SADUNF_Sadunf16G0274300 [Salix dunnii]
MKLGRDLRTGFDRYLSSWKSPDDPSRGNFTFRNDPNGNPEQILTENSIVRYRSGPWNGLRFSGVPQLRPNTVYRFEFVFNDKEIYYRYQLLNSSILSRLVLTQNGNFQRLTWTDQTDAWAFYLALVDDYCSRYALCGAYGSCDVTSSPACSCLKGFLPKVPKDWDMMNWSAGCARQTALNCSGDGFQKYTGLKLPDTRKSWFNKSMNLEECKSMCMKNCSCTAYANLDIREGGSGCLLWFSELIDMRELNENGQGIYIRMAASELDHDVDVRINSKSNKTKRMRNIVISVVTTGMLLLGLVTVLFLWKKKQKKGSILQRSAEDNCKKENPELQLFDFGTISCSTNNFSHTNKLGQGGFGPVYKLGRNTMTGLDRYLSSWKTPDDPSRGAFTYGLRADGYPEKVLRENSLPRYRSGPWNGIRFSGCIQMKPNPVYTYGFVFTEKEMYYSYQLLHSSILSRVVLSQNGNIQRFTWSSSSPSWVFYLTAQVDDCNRYALCGAYGSCHINDSPMCGCLRGFIPRAPKDWQMMSWSGGCKRRTPLNCSTDGFRKYTGVKLPETNDSWFSKSMNLEECKEMCTKNCSCIAYTNLDIREGGSGCLLWFSDLVDIRKLNEIGQDIYIRMAASELGNNLYSDLERGYTMSPSISFSENYEKSSINSIFQAILFTMFDLGAMAIATDNFSVTNKIGEGGFGPVYKAWRLFAEGRPFELIPESVAESYNLTEVLRSIHVGLLCVQCSPNDRPSMSSVVLMLCGEGTLPPPKQPGFFIERDLTEANTSSRQNTSCSVNEFTITQLEAR